MKKIPKYKQESLLRRVLLSKAWYLMKAEIITMEEYKSLIEKSEKRWGDTKTLDVFPDYYD